MGDTMGREEKGTVLTRYPRRWEELLAWMEEIQARLVELYRLFLRLEERMARLERQMDDEAKL